MRKCSGAEAARERLAGAAEIFRLLPDAERAVEGLDVDAAELATWLIEQGDPGWTRPPAMRQWARYFSRNGELPR